MLTANDVEFYRTNGYLAPIRAFSAEEAARYRGALEDFELHNPEHKAVLRNKTHLALAWADELIRHPGVLDAVETIIGPNILCWGSSFFIKNAHDPSYVSWHQDSTYWGLEPPDIVTAWVALSDSVEENGAMRVVPGTHLMDQVAHRDTFAQDNLLSRGQEIAVEVDFGAGGDAGTAAGRDVTASCAADLRVRSQSVGPAAYRFRYPLSADLCAPGGGKN